MKHTLYTPANCDHSLHDGDSTSCPVCDMGLGICKVCGGAEGWLTTDCPGERVPYEKGRLVGKGLLDYVYGCWRECVPGDCWFCGKKPPMGGHNHQKSAGGQPICCECTGNLPIAEE